MLLNNCRVGRGWAAALCPLRSVRRPYKPPFLLPFGRPLVGSGITIVLREVSERSSLKP